MLTSMRKGSGNWLVKAFLGVLMVSFALWGVADVFRGYGLAEEHVAPVVAAISAQPERWVDFMMRFELGLERPDKNRALQSAFVIGVSYIVGGLIPLSAYFFSDTTQQGLMYSCGITLVCLIVFGLVKSKLTGQPLFKGTLRVAFVGAMAAGAAYLLAKLIT